VLYTKVSWQCACARGRSVLVDEFLQATQRCMGDLPSIMGYTAALIATGEPECIREAQLQAATLRELATTWVPARVVAAMAVAAAGELEEAGGDVDECDTLLVLGGQSAMRGYEACVVRARTALGSAMPSVSSRAEGAFQVPSLDTTSITVSPFVPFYVGSSCMSPPTSPSSRIPASPLSKTLEHVKHPSDVVNEAIRVTLSLADPSCRDAALRNSFPAGVTPTDPAMDIARRTVATYLSSPLTPVVPDKKLSSASVEEEKEDEASSSASSSSSGATEHSSPLLGTTTAAPFHDSPEYDPFARMERWMLFGSPERPSKATDVPRLSDTLQHQVLDVSLGHALSASRAASASTSLAAESATKVDSTRISAGGTYRSQFGSIAVADYGNGYRGVEMTRDVGPDEEILSVDRKCLITVDHGKATAVGYRMSTARPALALSALKHCYTAVFLLLDQERPGSFFEPYYRILPKSFPSMPLFWDREKLGWLKGSHLLAQIADRRRNLETDYHEICRASPDFARFSVHQFTIARMVVASRNFGIVVDGKKVDALVPYADMLNHYRPRETRWAFNAKRQVFSIQSVTELRAGDQVFDSYGRKCNSRFLMNYGFTVEHNVDDDGVRSLNELLLQFQLPPAVADAWSSRKRALLDGASPSRGIRVAGYISHRGTQDALSFLRFALAEGRDVDRLPYIGSDCQLGAITVMPLSINNESRVLRELSALCEEQLERYDHSLEQDLAELCSGTCLRGSDRRNALVLLRGEKEVARRLVRLAEIAEPLLRVTPTELSQIIRCPVTEDPEINDYVRTVVQPLVNAAAYRSIGFAY
jgi:protein-histidine N-methyltransferase